MKKYHVYHSEEELEFDLDNDNYRYNTLNIYIGEHSFSIEMSADCRRLTTAVKRFSEGYKAAVADGVIPETLVKEISCYHLETLVEDAREMGEPLENTFYGIGELNDGTFVSAFELENEVEDSFYIRLTLPYEINGIEKNFPTVYVEDYFTTPEEPEIITVDDDGSNDEPDEDEEIKATPVSEDAEDEDDDLPDEYWIVKEENEMTTTKATTVITDAELTTKAAVAIDEAPTSEKATIRYIPCKGFSVNGDIFTSFKRGIEDWLENVICYDARAQLLVATRKQLIGIDGKPVRGHYSADRIIVKFNFDSHNDFRGDVKGDNHSIKVAPNEEYFDPEYEAQCKEIVTNWLDKNAGEYRKYQMRMEAKRRADKYYTENPDWNHNSNRVPNSQREAIREYLEQLHAADKTETTDKKESDAVNAAEINNQTDISTITDEIPATSIDSDATIITLGSLLVTALTALYNVTTAKPAAEPVAEPVDETPCTFEISDIVPKSGDTTANELADKSIDSATQATGTTTLIGYEPAIQQDASSKVEPDDDHEAPVSDEDAAEIEHTREVVKQAKRDKRIFTARIIGCNAELTALTGFFEAELEHGNDLETLIQTAKEIGACLKRRDWQQMLLDDSIWIIDEYEPVIAEYDAATSK